MRINKSVKEIVNYVHQNGDLNMDYFSANRAQLGIQAHQIVQKKYKPEQCEVPITQTITLEKAEITISGRIDLLLKDEQMTTVVEIKSTTKKLEKLQPNENPAHSAQAKFYAYMLMLQNDEIKNITVRIIYCDITGKKTRSFDENFDKEALHTFVCDTLEIYLDWILTLMNEQKLKLATAKTLDFPFGEFRAYQRELAGSVYHSIKNGENLLLRAPTGIGKTMATIFPSVKALTSSEQKIFYFTAKTIGRTVAQNAFKICQERGLKIKTTTITAKEKVCFMEEVRCDPSYCPYARGFFDRVRVATEDLFVNATFFDRETIDEYAKKHEICPFEFSLEMAVISDAVVADYNYLFDPRAYLKRFFDEESEHIALIDEAHNLYDRACEMFSASLSKNKICEVQKNYKGKSAKVTRIFNRLLELLDKFEYEYRYVDEFLTDVDYKLLSIIDESMQDLEMYLHRGYDLNDRKNLIEFYYDMLQFSRISDYFTESFRFRLNACDDDFIVSIICLNPGIHLANRLKNVKSGILFSATLHPLDYFQKVLLNDEFAQKLFLPSPFERENLEFTVDASLSTKYKARPFTKEAIINRIFELTKRKTGNYLVFFPSYTYMEQIFDAYKSYVGDAQNLIIQSRSMSESARIEFLNLFKDNNDSTLVAFAVLGGIFSEGIDLIGDTLIGAAIIGVGLPQINPLMQVRKAYFDQVIGDGYLYAYIIPGFNKVMQAVGRVIRTENDYGSVLLIDTRYYEPAYLDLFPYEWQHAKFIR